MNLVHTGQCRLVRSPVTNDDGTPVRYAILSHTWGKEEVSFEEFKSPDEATKQRDGYVKIFNACKQAERDGFAYIWIDTCCIDKSSSAELSEAINSMYR